MIELFAVLQRLVEPLADGVVYLPADAENLIWGRIPTAADQPVIKIHDGGEIVIDTVSHEGILEDQGRDPRTFFTNHGVAEAHILRDAIEVAAGGGHDPALDGPHVITGPIAVVGARPGDLLAIDVLELTPRCSYGVISNRHGKGALPGEMPNGPDPEFTFCRAGQATDGPTAVIDTVDGEIQFPLSFFLGIMGVATAATDHRSSVPPGLYGGNLDVSMVTEGATLYLPVQVPEALAFIGDPHFAQGDGEVALTALEAPLRARLRFRLVTDRDAAYFTRPYAETADLLVPIGLDEDLDLAMQDCVRSALNLLQQRYHVNRATAYAYLSAAGDFAVSQVVDGVKGVHGKIRKSDLIELLRTVAI